MTGRRTRWCSVVGGGALLALAMLAAGGAGMAPGEDAEPGKAPGAITGPIVAITLLSDPEDLVLLTDVSLRLLGERSFVVGQGADDGETDWRTGRTAWIAVDDIQQLVEFPGIEAFHESIKRKKDDIDANAASRTAAPSPRRAPPLPSPQGPRRPRPQPPERITPFRLLQPSF